MRTVFLLLAMLCVPRPAQADWLTARSFYTHDPSTGQRTDQYAEPPRHEVPQPPSYRTSGYTFFRSSLQYGASTDQYQRVDQWGPPIQPYGEWRFPFRPYSAPYDQWGAPFAGLNLGFPYPYPGYGASGYRGGYQGGGRPNDRFPGNRRGNGRPDRGYGPSYPGPSYPGPYGQGGYQQDGLLPWQPQIPYAPAPWTEGEYNDTGLRPRMNDRQFFRKPRQ